MHVSEKGSSRPGRVPEKPEVKKMHDDLKYRLFDRLVN